MLCTDPSCNDWLLSLTLVPSCCPLNIAEKRRNVQDPSSGGAAGGAALPDQGDGRHRRRARAGVKENACKA